MALHLGHSYPEATTRVSLPCRHGVEGICVPIVWSGTILGVLSVAHAPLTDVERIARVLAPYAFRLIS
jgi:hypothetical protein